MNQNIRAFLFQKHTVLIFGNSNVFLKWPALKELIASITCDRQ